MPNPDKLPTGGELIDEYLRPLAALPQLRSQIHLNSRVIGISRRRIDKMKDAGRVTLPLSSKPLSMAKTRPFWRGKPVIHATGTWATPNPVGVDGLFAPGERANQDKIAYGIPDVLGTQRSRYLGKHVAVVGGGHSAINVISGVDGPARDRPGNADSLGFAQAQCRCDLWRAGKSDELPGVVARYLHQEKAGGEWRG